MVALRSWRVCVEQQHACDGDDVVAGGEQSFPLKLSHQLSRPIPFSSRVRVRDLVSKRFFCNNKPKNKLIYNLLQ